jgi:hypothetical protein
MIDVFLSMTGLVAFVFLACLSVSPYLIRGLVRLLTAHRLGLEAFSEARRRYIKDTRPENREAERLKMRVMVD